MNFREVGKLPSSIRLIIRTFGLPTCNLIVTDHENSYRQRPQAETPGKRSPDGRLLEYAWNKEIASRINDRLLTLGYDSSLLVPEIGCISLTERCSRTNDWCARLGKDNVSLVSVHVNAAGNGDPDKEEAFYILKHTPGRCPHRKRFHGLQR